MATILRHLSRARPGLMGFASGRAATAAAPRMASSLSLVIAEHTNGGLSPSTYSAVTAASRLSGEVDVLILGEKCEGAALAASGIPGVRRVLRGDHPAFAHQIAENVAPAVAKIAKDGSYTHVMTLSTMAGKNVAGRLASQLDAAPVTDVVDIVGPHTFKRPTYAGNAISTVQASDVVKVLTVRPTAFEKAPSEGGSASVEDAQLPENPDLNLTEFVSETVGGGERPDLTGARVVVSGGRGLKNGENFSMLEELADVLGGAVGATRAAVDAGFVPNELQVGQTGKVVAPELYIAVGISGAIQHISGMKDSKCIVAINKDKEAPIFSVADHGLVADLFEAVPQLTEELKRAGSS